MLSEEQIQRLTKIAVDDLDYDENQAEKEIRLAANLLNSIHEFLTLFGYNESKESVGRFLEEFFSIQIRFFKKINEKKKNSQRRP